MCLAFFAVLAVMPGSFIMQKNVYRQLPLFRFLERKAARDFQRKDPDTYAKIVENHTEYLGAMVEKENEEVRKEQEKVCLLYTSELAFTREGAHSQPRILFYEDVTGKQITQTLLGEALTRENIEICEYMTMVDLISRDNICGGVIVMDEQNNVYPIRSPHVVLACGGLGGLYKNSTNFPHIAGDGLGIAMKHQVELEHLDYIQIHPTTLYSRKPGRRFLISESDVYKRQVYVCS